MCSVRSAISSGRATTSTRTRWNSRPRKCRRDTEPPSRSTCLVRNDLLLPGDREGEVIAGVGSERVDQGVANVGAVLGQLAERDVEVTRSAGAVTETYL